MIPVRAAAGRNTSNAAARTGNLQHPLPSTLGVKGII
jgi:hypothetical protein